MTGVVESWANSALSWMQGLAEDEEVWNRTMGTTPDFFQKPVEEESGLLCAYSYFHTLYVLEWYYDYIGYDYYHQDFNFYYYDDCNIQYLGCHPVQILVRSKLKSDMGTLHNLFYLGKTSSSCSCSASLSKIPIFKRLYISAALCWVVKG